MRQIAPANGVVVLIVSLCAAIASVGCSGGSSPSARASAGSGGEGEVVALKFSLRTPGGESVDLGQFEGQVRVVDFWATWCPPCREAIPHLNDLQRKFRDRGVVVVGISVDENPRLVTAFNEEVRIEYTSLMTSPQVEIAFGEPAGLPATFVLDARGRIVASYIGAIGGRTLEDAVEKALSGGRG